MNDWVKAFIVIGLLVITCILFIYYLSIVSVEHIKSVHDTLSKYKCSQLEEIRNSDHFSEAWQNEAESQYLNRCL